ncbi:MAG: radical SAM protein, partial [Candidatus Methanofastidiosa archaeon]|nr:radical SAM protein [Candidatus Methanofastidiosa archaeon]
MYFRLNPECYFIKGKKSGAIFDLIDEKIYALDPKETELIALCEKNKSVSGSEEFLNEIKALRLGNFYPNKKYILKLRNRSLRQEDASSYPPELNRVILELNNTCERDCWFCGYYGVKRSAGCI